MKKDRNCNNIPVYPIFPMNMMPGIPSMNTTQYQDIPTNYMNTSIDQQISQLNNQINSLERRITNLENIIGKNNYNTTNYQML